MKKTFQAPNGWNVVKIKDIAQVNPRSNPVDKDIFVTFLPMSAVSETGYIQGAQVRKADDVMKGFTSFETGDVLVAKITPCFENYKGCLCTELCNNHGYGSTEFHVLRPQKNIAGEYLHIITRTHHFRGTGELNMIGTAGQKRVPTIFLKNYEFPIPPLPEQKAIADLLSTWDEAIEKTERLIQAKEKRFQWLLRKLISEPQNTRNTQKKAGWKRVKIGSFLTESRIPDRENNPQKRLSVRLHLKGVEIREYRGTESDMATTYFVRKAGQFIYGKQNIFRGSVGIVPPELDGYSSTQDIPAFNVSDSVCKNWLLFLFSCPNFYKKLELYASGSGSKRLHPKELFKMKIALPSLEEQQEIAGALSLVQHEIDLLKQLADKYKTQKRGLMQKMLTGEWRVKSVFIDQFSKTNEGNDK